MGFYYSNEMKSAYNRMAKKYHTNRDVFNLDYLYIQLKKELPKSGKLLDLGCGAGDSISLEFAKDNWEIDGFDFSEEMLKLAKINNPIMNLTCCDLCDINLEDDKYSCVISIYALFHLPVEEQFKLMKKVYSALQVGGIFFFTYGLDNHPSDITKEEISSFMNEKLFYAQAEENIVIEKIKEIGFSIISNEEQIIGGESFHWYTIRK